MRLLARREHGAVELQRKLIHHGHEDAEALQAIDELRARQWQSDERYATAMARTRIERGYGPRYIRAELEARAVAREIIVAVLDALQVDWTRLATQARRRRFGEKLPTTPAERAKQQRFLEQRGFAPAQIRATFAQAGDDFGDEEGLSHV